MSRTQPPARPPCRTAPGPNTSRPLTHGIRRALRDAARFDAPDDRIAHASVRTGERRSTYLDGVALAHSTDPEIPGSREELSGQDDRLPAHQRAARHHGALDAAAVSRTGQGALA